jgi:hypothetical protein
VSVCALRYFQTFSLSAVVEAQLAQRAVPCHMVTAGMRAGS